MKEEISSLELHYLVKEFQDIINGRVDKIYQDGRSFLITMHVRGKGRRLLKIDSNIIYLTEHKEEFAETPPGYCAFLRKYLSGGFIREIKQIDFERILEITFESKERKYFMIIELFSNGNVILCDEEYKVLSALESHKWKDRTVRGGIKYEHPPEQNNSFELYEKEFSEIIKNSKRDALVKTLAKEISLGGLYAEELCLLSKVDKIMKPTLNEIKELHKQLKKLFSKKIKAN
ncbi:NFACT family protein, partial [Bacteroidota bacterium]